MRTIVGSEVEKNRGWPGQKHGQKLGQTLGRAKMALRSAERTASRSRTANITPSTLADGVSDLEHATNCTRKARVVPTRHFRVPKLQ